jgi:hypothetical protein
VTDFAADTITIMRSEHFHNPQTFLLVHTFIFSTHEVTNLVYVVTEILLAMITVSLFSCQDNRSSGRSWYAVQGSRTHHSGVLHTGRAQYSAVQCSTAQYSTAQYSAVQYSPVQYSPVQYSPVQYSPVQPSTVQYRRVENNALQ